MMSEQLFPTAAGLMNRCNRLNPLFNSANFVACLDLILSITSSESDPPVTPRPLIRSFLRFREQQTSEAGCTFPVEWSQQPHDLINGDKHKPALTSVTLHSNKDMKQVQPKSLLQAMCARVCFCVCVHTLSSSCQDLFCTLIVLK